MAQAGLELYATKVENVLVKLLNQEDDWKATATELERQVVENSLLPPEAMPLPKNSPRAFALHLISAQDCIWENSRLPQLYKSQWDPEEAVSPADLVSHLLI